MPSSIAFIRSAIILLSNLATEIPPAHCTHYQSSLGSRGYRLTHDEPQIRDLDVAESAAYLALLVDA